MELVEYAQAVDHSRMPLLLRVLNALGWCAFLADILLMAYAYCLVMARNGFPNLTMDEGRLVGASVLLPFVALALMSPAENWNPRGPKPKTMDEYVGDVWNLDGLAIAEPGYMDPLSGFPRIKGSYRVSWKRNGRRVEGTLGIDGANVELRDNQGMIVSPVNPGTPVWKPGAKHSKGSRWNSPTATNYAAIFSPTNICPNICANGRRTIQANTAVPRMPTICWKSTGSRATGSSASIWRPATVPCRWTCPRRPPEASPGGSSTIRTREGARYGISA